MVSYSESYDIFAIEHSDALNYCKYRPFIVSYISISPVFVPNINFKSSESKHVTFSCINI